MNHKLLTLTASFVLLTTLSSAAPAELQVYPDQPGVEVNSFAQYQIDVTNSGTSETTYTLSSEEPAVTVAPSQVTVGAGETETINAWFNPSERMESGVYSWELTSESREGETSSVTMSANIIRDHQTAVSAQEEITGCLGEESTLEIEVTNNGIQSETFEVISRRGEPESQEITLEPDETRTVEVTLSSDEEISESFHIISSSTSSYAQDSTEVDWTVENCYESTLSSEEEVRGAALGTTETELEIENTGTRDDTFSLESTLGELSDEEITVESEETEEFVIEFAPENLFEENVEVTAEGQSTSSTEFKFESYNGMASSVNFESEDLAKCQEFGEESVDVTIQNTGELAETFELEANRGNLEDEEVTLDPEENETITLIVNPSQMYESGESEVEVSSTASSFGEPTSTATADIDLENCFDAELNVVPEVTSVGEDRSTLYEIQVTNTGTRENTFELTREGPEWTSISPDELTIQPGETRTSYMYAAAPFEKEGEVKITVTAEGREVIQDRTVQLNIDEEIEEAILRDRDLTRFTGRFTESVTGLTDRMSEYEIDLPVDWRLAVSILVGLLLALGVLYS